jgi:hypothetical protein
MNGEWPHFPYLPFALGQLLSSVPSQAAWIAHRLPALREGAGADAAAVEVRTREAAVDEVQPLIDMPLKSHCEKLQPVNWQALQPACSKLVAVKLVPVKVEPANCASPRSSPA